MNRFIWIIFFLISAKIMPAQIVGMVLEKESRKPISGATVIADQEIAITDNKGDFQLSKASSRIIISHIGFKSDTIVTDKPDHKYVIYLETEISSIDQVIIKASYNNFPLEQMPSSAGFIGDLQKQNQNVINFVGNLNQIPGVFSQVGANNTNRITIRGIGSRIPYGTNRIKAYYNDIPLTSGDGNTEIEDISVSNIGTIEVLKGSKSALYGSGLGGVIIINKPKVKNGLHGALEANLASFGTYTALANIRFMKKGGYISGNYSKTLSDGWRENSKYNRDNFMLSTGYVTARSHIDITLMAIRTKAYIPSSINRKTFESSPESAAPNWIGVKGFEKYNKLIASLSYKHNFSESLKNETNIFALLKDGYESRPFNILDDASNNWGIRNVTALQINRLKIQVGIEALFEKYQWHIFETDSGIQGSELSRFSEKRTPVSVFLNGQYKFKNESIIEAGLSLNTLSYDLTDEFNPDGNLSGKYSYGTVVSPFLGINIPAGNLVNIYGSISNGFSAPSVEETLLPEGSINPDLKPETGISIELGLRYTSENKRIFLDACVYNMWIRNLLVTRRENEEVFYGVNAGKTQHTGVELSSRISLFTENRPFPVLVNISYNYIHAKFTDFVDDGVDYANKTLPGIPDHNIWTSAILSSPYGALLSIQYQFAGKQYLNDANNQIYGFYQLMHIMLDYSYNINRAELILSGGIRNIFNEHYASMVLVNAPSFGGNSPRYFYPGMPRNYFLSLGIRF